ncbi:hypothetical protein M422DRAFT_28270 [Sphaerobolus stellatus SS14]|uniref:Uncharacterized protein n=1 Tax=Sphaerobolus stellatus (strain SS14) TaxID=990650 RepID=A0A0C9V8U7_SPHS4|nr:hypothetical protein M422DRAFT_33533 [Sphaerobolus stellatus SS14]KIJ48901.1 hypothetical protein M422DRAFT_28270 [Sphaerobolus stellatus SS14]
MTREMKEEVARVGPSNWEQPGLSNAAEEDLIPRRIRTNTKPHAEPSNTHASPRWTSRIDYC